jgi:1-acyl-sn-glycerol-3-phosphate acyltransferase
VSPYGGHGRTSAPVPATGRATDPRAAERARYLAALQRLGSRQGRLDHAVRLLVRLGFASLGWRVQAEGTDLLPRDRGGRVLPCVLAAAPHRGWPDPFLVLLAWPREAPRLAWFGDEVTMTRSWWRRRLLPRLGMIPIPARPSVGAVGTYLDAARLVLDRGCVLVVFSEKGPPSPRGRTRTIAPGAAWLSLAADVPLVPVALAGFLETGLGTRFRVRFLPAIGRRPQPTAAARPGDDRVRLAREGRTLTAALAAALAGPVAALEAASLRDNGRRPMPGLRRLFR